MYCQGKVNCVLTRTTELCSQGKVNYVLTGKSELCAVMYYFLEMFSLIMYFISLLFMLI